MQTHSIDPSSVEDGMNMKLVTKKKGNERKKWKMIYVYPLLHDIP
jgi:hypothetical protein